MEDRIYTRREVVRVGLGGLVLALVSGCPGGVSAFPTTGDGTGVRGWDTPRQILSDPNVSHLIDILKGRGHYLNLSEEINPPSISGSYAISGERIVPGRVQLDPGTFRWSNQTSENKIDTDYDQLTGQSGISSLGEIIRGAGNAFTVYSILNIADSSVGCSDRFVIVVDGIKDGSGNVSGVYFGTPTNERSCLSSSAGTLNLTLNGIAKQRGFSESQSGASLIAHKEL